MLFDPRMMDLYLGCCGVLLKEFGSFAEGMTMRVKQLAKDRASLAKFFPQFLHHAIRSFASVDVLRFLGKRINETTGKVAANFRGQVTTSLKERPEGVRLRHALNGNSLKIYDKEGTILRVETTIVHPEEFKVYRPVRDQAEGQFKWQRLRRRVADLYRRAEVSQAANSRYLEALASVTGTTPLFQEAQSVCRALIVKGRRYRPLNPWSTGESSPSMGCATAIECDCSTLPEPPPKNAASVQQPLHASSLDCVLLVSFAKLPVPIATF
jgi:hypothetical protein